MLTVGTFWGGAAQEALHRELLRTAEKLGAVGIEVRTFTYYGLLDYLAKNQPQNGEEHLDLVVVPNEWLGQLAERGIIGELPAARVEELKQRLVSQALLAVSDRDRVLAYPISVELLALVYDPRQFPSPPRSMDDLLAAPLPPDTYPVAVNLGSAYQLAPFVGSYLGSLVDVDGDFVWSDDVLLKVVRRLAPVWQRPGAWRLFSGDDLESLQLQLFAEGRLASFLAGPWLLDALEETGRPFAVMPIPGFADAPHPVRALASYQCVAVTKDTRWADLALEVADHLLDEAANERLTHATRRLPVLIASYQSEQAMASQGTVGFLRALEQGQFFPATAHWSEGFQGESQHLQKLARRLQPPPLDQLRAILVGGAP